MAPHAEQCICAVCTCGRHKLCKVPQHVDSHLDAHTEYGDNYLKYQAGPRTRGRAHPQQLDWKGGAFLGSTENREKYVSHPVAPHQAPAKVMYSRNDAPFEGTTTSKNDYPAWDIAPVQQKRPPATVMDSGKFDGSTTNKRDYQPFELQPRTFHKAAEWMKPTTRFSDETTNHADFRAWKVAPHANAHPPAKHVNVQEDRDFKSTTAAAYTGNQLAQRAAMAPRAAYMANPVKFEGTSTNTDSFRRWDLPPKNATPKAAYVPNQSHFDDATTYKTNYQPKSVERTTRSIAQYQAPNTKFEGLSTHHADFSAPGRQTRELDFRPRVAYNAVGDDRDWLTTMRSQYTPKPIAKCPAVDWIPQERERHVDGHVYLAHHAAAEPAEAHA
ncbi:hypothetical protein PhCBS80983_g03172 [Powellomyces hirtus]|uniref:Uncharacterized protein n=1 Tax=Powellomyces hirtus TaxID=109895 RepID=A0A507E3G6_9FUNG|nr:hypothetical protein PhCBS80983_g03172 [Powellomyces hirtus]